MTCVPYACPGDLVPRAHNGVLLLSCDSTSLNLTSGLRSNDCPGPCFDLSCRMMITGRGVSVLCTQRQTTPSGVRNGPDGLVEYLAST